MANRIPVRRFVISAVVALTAAGATPPAHAADPVPATQPAAASSPRQTLRALVSAMDAGDAATLRSLFVASTPVEVEAVDAMVDFGAAIAALRKAAVTAYGKAGAFSLTGDTEKQTADSLARIAAAEEKIDDDRATITTAGAGGTTYSLRRVDGVWKIAAASILPAGDEATVRRRLADAKAQTAAVRLTTTEITLGKLKSAEEARQRLQRAVQGREG